MNMVNPDNEVRHFSRQLRVHIKEWLFRLQKLKIHVPDNVIMKMLKPPHHTIIFVTEYCEEQQQWAMRPNYNTLF